VEGWVLGRYARYSRRINPDFIRPGTREDICPLRGYVQPVAPMGVVPDGVVTEAVGDVLGDRYRLDELLGIGGMGRVFAAHDLLLDRRVAVKLPTVSSERARDRFRHEARAAASLNHRNIVSVYDWGESPDSPYLVMELVDGRSLRDVLREHRALSPRDVAAIGVQIADALAHAHAHGVIHRDVKPSNILLTTGGRDVKVTDFGISKSTGAEALTEPGTVMGTPGYLSPEQSAGLAVDARSDVYSLGVVLGELLTGTRDGTVDAHAGVTELERVVTRARAQDPATRYQLASDLSDVLQAVVRLLDSPVTAKAVPASTATMAPAAAVAPAVVAPAVVAVAPAVVPPRAPAPPPVRKAAPSKPRRWRVRHLVALVSAPLALVAGGAFAYYELTRPPAVQVPNVVERDVFTAADTLQKAGFHVDSIVADNPRPGGVVFAQSPRRGKLDEGSTVTITISDVVATVPDVVGADVDTALAAIHRLGFVDVQVVDDYRDDVDPGTVVGTTPVAFSSSSKAAPVQVVVARDPHVTVPNLVAVDQATASRTLEGLGLVVAVKTASSQTVGSGLVISASPSVDRVVLRGTTVTLTVSSGPKLASVPYVVGWSADDAVSELEDAGFAVAIVTTPVPNSQVGEVVAENPPGGRAAEGSTVTVTVGTRQPGKSR
jgi:serine/threonine-protein kinase